tara:strand:+ start:737 stop:1483 length:747 start_codon:yes stop_codon:yes gene_type:complete
MPLSKIHNTLTSDHILLDGTDSTGANANSKVLLDASASNTDVGALMSYEAGAVDGSAMLTNTHLADMVSPVRSAGRTITIPDVTEPILTDADNHFQQFRLTTSQSISTINTIEDITSNLEEVDSRAVEGKGSLVSESSGIFSFSKTGYYHIGYKISIKGHSYDNYGGGGIRATPDNSTYDIIAEGFEHSDVTSGDRYSDVYTDATFKVTDINNQKVKFFLFSDNTNMNTEADTDRNRTYMTFQRIGDL